MGNEKLMTPPGKSGKQQGEENVKKLRQYVDALKSEGARLPSRNGNPDKSAIALAAGFSRLTLYNNPAAISLLEEAVEDVGLEGTPSPGSAKADHLQHQVDRRERRIQRLEELLATKTAENEALRKENREIIEKLRQYSVMEEIMATSGRKFRP
jgi:hypothetical protein